MSESKTLLHNLPFSKALEYLKEGRKIARQGWNGKGMFLLVKESDYFMPDKPIIEGEIIGLLPWIGMKTADNKFVPWLASQTDILADDWCIIE